MGGWRSTARFVLCPRPWERTPDMPRLLVIDDRDQTVEMCHRQLPQFDYQTRCDRRIPCQVCEERDKGCPLKCAHDYQEATEALARTPALPDLVVLDLHFAVPP